jgi:hypothetical protein
VTESIDYPEQMRRDREEIARLQGCPVWPACGCGTQSGPHTCEWKKMAAEIAHLTAQRDQLLASLSWMEDQDPQLVDAAREKFNLTAVEEKP